MLDQPSLLDWVPPSATIIRLPLSRWGQAHWRDRVGPVASELIRRRSEVSRAGYWKAQVIEIEEGLQSSFPLSESEIDAEIGRFRQAVIAAMARLQNEARRM